MKNYRTHFKLFYCIFFGKETKKQKWKLIESGDLQRRNWGNRILRLQPSIFCRMGSQISEQSFISKYSSFFRVWKTTIPNSIKCISSKRGKLYRWWKISDALIDQPEMARILRRNEGVSPVFFIIPPLPAGPRRAPIATPSPRFALGRCFSRGHCIRQATPLLCQASRDIEM